MFLASNFKTSCSRPEMMSFVISRVSHWSVSTGRASIMTSLTKSRIWLAIEYHRNQNRGGLFSQRGMFKTWMWERTTISVPPRRPHEPGGIRTHPNFTQCQLYVEVWRTNRLGHSASHFDIKLTLREIGMGSNPTWVMMSLQRKWNSVFLSH